MKTSKPTPAESDLTSALSRLDRKPYPAYKDILGTWTIGQMTLVIDHVQGDPFASPSRLRLFMPTAINQAFLTDRAGKEAAEDWALRHFLKGLPRHQRGSGKSGLLSAYAPGPEVTERSALRLHPDGVAEIRFRAGLPAQGRRILGRQAIELLLVDLPCAAARIHSFDGLEQHVLSVRRQRDLRAALTAKGLIAFVGNGSVLPRRTGVDHRPLQDAVPFQSPQKWETTLKTSQGDVTGMGIPEGITLIVGGGFHGKSTILQAIQQGHLDHIPGDGRETVVALPRTVKVRAEDGRYVVGVDISPFLNGLPGGRDTQCFHTEDASGSTSQAAAIIEAIESGATTLLLDEDTSATNLLIRDDRMRQLIPDESEPITPLLERIQQMHRRWGVSTIMVVGGIGDYLSVADQVIAMEHYRPKDVTTEAKRIASAPPSPRGPLPQLTPRIPLMDGLAPNKVRARNKRTLGYGSGEIDLSAVEQVLDTAHAATLGEALRFLHQEWVNGDRNIVQLLDALDAILNDEGIEALSPRNYPSGDLVRPRRHEIAAALSRHRTLRVATKPI